MKRKGPCSHCGINSTPLWRQGPAGKPVLCNACGSRYKSKGTLENYLPKNAQHQLSVNNNVGKVYDRSNLSVGDNLPKHVARTGGINTNLWNTKIPSRKRSVVVRKRMTPMERFQKQLLSLWKSMGQPNESSPEDILLFDNNVNNFIPRNEIGLGCTLIKTDVTSTSQHHSHAISSIENQPSIL